MAVHVFNSEGTETVTYAGRVLEARSSYLGDGESSYYVVVWDSEAGRPADVFYSSTYGDRRDYAMVDATPEATRAYESWKAAKEAAVVAPGKTVRVVAGRKVPKGTVGVVFWMGDNKYGPGMRVGFTDAAGNTHWINASYVEVVSATAAAA